MYFLMSEIIRSNMIVDYFVHLGHVITHHLADNDDILRRRNEFIGQVNNVLCFFSRLKSCIVY